MVWGGTLLCIVSLICASFAKEGWQLLLSQGIGYGVGVLVVYYPILAMVNSWFYARRGFAYGVLFAAAGASGTGLPFLINVLLERFGYRWTLRGYAIGIIILLTPTFPFCHGRPLNKGLHDTSRKPNWEILKNPSLIVFSLANLFQGLAYYIPSLYLPSYASTLNLSTTQVVFIIALLNASQVIAQVLLGHISDTTSVFLLAPISTLGAAAVTLGLWYFGHTAGTVLAYSVLFGLFTGGFTSLWARFNMSLSSDKATQEFAYGLLATQRGLGIVLAGPISTALFRMGSDVALPATRHMYGPLTLFVFACTIMASFGGLGFVLPKEKGAPPPSPPVSRRGSVWELPRRYSRYVT
jgi:MFS family permease